MTYCLAIKVDDGLILASDSRTHAGVDYVSTYSKMHVFGATGERFFVLLAAGSLATTQAVVNNIQRDLETPDAAMSLNKVEYVFDAARYVGAINYRVQQEHAEALKQSGASAEASFILGGQLSGKPHEIYLIYPQGNYIAASSETPYLQIGESKYGKPILDRVIASKTSLEDAARCALVSLDSTMRSNISVGPPLELAFYRKDQLALQHHLVLDSNSPLIRRVQQRWNDGLRRAFNGLPRFDWEAKDA
jgi:putative proteasome-type protease